MRRQAENRATVPRGLSVVKRFRNFAEKKQIERLLLLKKKYQKELGPAVSAGLRRSAYSQALSRY